MKLLIVTVIEECQQAMAHIFAQNEISIYSVNRIYGIKNEKEVPQTDSWFSRDWQEDYDSVMLFSFTSIERADSVLKAIEQFNKEKGSRFPVKGAVLSVENAAGFF